MTYPQPQPAWWIKYHGPARPVNALAPSTPQPPPAPRPDARAKRLAGLRRRNSADVLRHALSAAAFGPSDQRLYAALLASAIVRAKPELAERFAAELTAAAVELT